MNCKKCDYPLWNLRARVCPECGEPFLPSHYRFALNSVRFCCPHCLQDYYGTGEIGHLVPRHFECVRCRRHIDMDETILLPTEGITERQTKADVNPWLDTERGIFTRWLATIGRGMANPVWLLRSTPIDTGAGQGWGFAVLTHLAFAAVFLVPLLLFYIVLNLAGSGAGMPFGLMGVGFVTLSAAPTLGSLIFLGVWIATAHGLLRLGGDTAGGIGRTSLALCFTCGPQLIMLIPCLNIYFGWIGALWWIIVAGFALSAAQKVSGGRAALAAAALPALCGLVLVGAIAFQFARAIRMGAGGGWTSYTSGTECVSPLRAPIQSAVVQGRTPRHAADIIADGSLPASQFVSAFSGTTPAQATIGGMPLERVYQLSPEQRQTLVQRARDSLLPGSVAHRVGDFVFALDALGPGDPGLWVVVESWHPSWNPGVTHTIYVLTAGGQVITIAPETMAQMLALQNAQRKLHNLPPLPDPATVREDGSVAPAGGG